VVTLDELFSAGERRKDQTREAGRVAAGYARVGLWSIGWVLAKLVTLVFAAVAGVFFAIGWCCAQTVPVLRWARTAFVLGWEAGRASGGARVSS
jgi:hypothetical protein